MRGWLQVRAVQDLQARLGKLTATIAAASADSARSSSLTRLQGNKAKLLEDLAAESRTLEWHQAVAVRSSYLTVSLHPNRKEQGKSPEHSQVLHTEHPHSLE